MHSINRSNVRSFIATALIVASLSACSTAQVPSVPGQEPGLPEGQSKKATVYMMKPNDNGKSGQLLSAACPDSLVPVEVLLDAPYIARDPSASIFMSLLALKRAKGDAYAPQGLENPLAKSQLQEPKMELVKELYVVRLKGTITVGNECDAKRQRAQIEETIRHAAGTHSFMIDFNGAGPQGWEKAFEVK